MADLVSGEMTDMSQFSENVMAGFKIGSAIRNRKRDDEKYDFEKEKRDAERAGNKQWGDFLDSQMSNEAPRNNPMVGGVSIKSPHDAKQGIASPVAQGVNSGAVKSSFKAPGLEDAQKNIALAGQMAAKYPHLADRYNAWKPAYAQAAMQSHQQKFKGDLNTIKGLQDYTTHMAKGAGILGDVISPEEAKTRYDQIQSMVT